MGNAHILGDIVIRAETQPGNDIEIAIARGQKNDRQRGGKCAQIAAQGKPAVDFVVRGDGEVVARALAASLQTGSSAASVAGVTWRDESGQIIRNQPAQTTELDALPVPDRDTSQRVLDLGLSLAMFTKRGCPYRCSFCTKGVRPEVVGSSGSDVWRKKPAHVAANEFLALAERFGVSHITITDDLFTSRDARSIGWVREFASILQEVGNRTTFMIDTRADGVSRELFAELRAAGLRRVFIGVESGSDDDLAHLNKQLQRRSIIRAIDVLAELEIEVMLGFMFFTPFSTRDSLLDSTRLLREIRANDLELHLQKTRVYPGTDLEEILRRQALLRGEFPHYSSAFADPQLAEFSAAFRRLANHVDGTVELMPDQQPERAEGLFDQFNRAVQRAVESRHFDEAEAERWFLEESASIDGWMNWHRP